MTYFAGRPIHRTVGKSIVGKTTYTGLPNESGYLINQLGYFGYYNPRLYPSLSQKPDPALFYYYSEGSDTDNAGMNPTTFYGGLQRFGTMFTNPDQYGASRQGTGGFSYSGNYVMSTGYTSYPSDLGGKIGYFGQ